VNGRNGNSRPEPSSADLLRWDELKFDALLISWLPNVRYVSGFTGSNGMVLLTPDAMTLFTDPRYAIQAAQESRARVVIAKGPLVKAAAQAIGRKRVKRVGFEKSHLTYESWQSLKELLPLGATLKPAGALLEQRRMIKSAGEIERIRKSVQTNSAAYAAAINKVRPGLSEEMLAAEIEYQMRRRGAEKPAFETIVASGARTALPHAQPTAQRFGDHDLVLIDMGATQEGYASDMTRMVFLGKPGAEARKMYDAVLEAQLAAIDAVRDGVAADRVDAAARRVLKAKGLEKAFVHSTGHGLGLEIHEPPRLGKKDKTRLQSGMVITIEPGVYLEGVGGVRIEDTVLVTEKGCEILTPTTKELTVL
jgi:Xaa-Pro aminopeptidase